MQVFKARDIAIKGEQKSLTSLLKIELASKPC